jgi:hypothetical protein
MEPFSDGAATLLQLALWTMYVKRDPFGVSHIVYLFFFLILILEQHMYLKFWLCHDTITVKGARGKVWFDSLNIKYVSKLSCYTSAEAYLSHRNSKMTNALFNFLSDKYASGEASLDNFEAYLSFCESNNTSPRAPFTVINKVDNS